MTPPPLKPCANAESKLSLLPAKDNNRGEMRFVMADVYGDLARRDVTHLLIEPGAKLARELMVRNEADRAWVFRGQVTIGGGGIDAAQCRWPAAAAIDLGGDRLTEHLNPQSAVFFAPERSADLLLTVATTSTAHESAAVRGGLRL